MKLYIQEILRDAKEFMYLLMQSLVSPSFYQDVYFKYSGYGMNFILVCIYTSSLLVTLFMINKIQNIQNYFDTKIVTNYETSILDTILSNWQVFYYNGTNIYSDDSELVMIKGSHAHIIAAIDPNDELSGSVKQNIPIIFTKTKLLIGVQDNIFGAKHIPIEYSEVFGKSHKTIIVNQELIANIGKIYATSLMRLMIYIFFPLYTLLSFLAFFIDRSLLILIVFFIAKILFPNKSDLKSCIRLVMFSGGFYAFFFPLSILSHAFGTMAQLSQFWTSGIIIYALLGKL